MVEHIVRFSEFEYYNVKEDEDWVRFMATMDKGSYYAEIPRGTASEVRKNRDIFKAKVIDCLVSCINPCEVSLEETIH